MGLLDDAIREHLELKRLRGADPVRLPVSARGSGPRAPRRTGRPDLDLEGVEDVRSEAIVDESPPAGDRYTPDRPPAAAGRAEGTENSDDLQTAELDMPTLLDEDPGTPASKASPASHSAARSMQDGAERRATMTRWSGRSRETRPTGWRQIAGTPCGRPATASGSPARAAGSGAPAVRPAPSQGVRPRGLTARRTFRPAAPRPSPTLEYVRGHSSAGRAPALQAGGHRFDPGWLHRRKQPAKAGTSGKRSVPRLRQAMGPDRRARGRRAAHSGRRTANGAAGGR